jgi:glycosyltransferase involved in cell wall biosynthesis
VRVAFPVIGGAAWTGGRHYLRNLLSSLALLGPSRIEPVLFAGSDVPESEMKELATYLISAPRRSRLLNGGSRSLWTRAARSGLRQRDRDAEALFRGEAIDLVFQHSAWYGPRFGIPTLAWIADLQHRRLPGMFSPGNWLRRELGYWGLSFSATTILLSSRDARDCCERCYPMSRGRTAVLPFAPSLSPRSWDGDLAACRSRYGLPERFLYLPSQFWKHKNHAAVVDAMRGLAAGHPDLVLAMSGALLDPRHPAHPREVLASIERSGLERACRVLGVIPYEDVLALARGAVAVVNASFSEGWSTTVEEAKAFGTPLVLSDLPVHREQAPPGSPRHSKEAASVAARERQARFAEGFLAIAKETIARHPIPREAVRE